MDELLKIMKSINTDNVILVISMTIIIGLGLTWSL